MPILAPLEPQRRLGYVAALDGVQRALLRDAEPAGGPRRHLRADLLRTNIVQASHAILPSRALRFGPLRYGGRISYGLYVWHPVVLWPTGYVGPTQRILLSLAVASGLYYGIERPVLRRKEQPTSAPAVAAAAPA